MDKNQYQKERIAHWENVSLLREKPKRIGVFYHELLQHYYKLLIPPDVKVLELGCGHGDLLAALMPWSGVGIDFSSQMINVAKNKYPELKFIQADAHDIYLKETFDVIILSDLVNDVWDLQSLMENLRNLTHEKTRLILNFYNNIWRIPLSVLKMTGKGAMTLQQNWFAPQDIYNLLNLSDFEVIRHSPKILFPLRLKLLSPLANRFLVNIFPFTLFALTHFIAARPCPKRKNSASQSASVIVPARNEAGNIESIIHRVPDLSDKTEIIFVEGGSSDNTYETIQHAIEKFPQKNCKLFRQQGRGKGDAVRLGFEKASGDILMILDADMTVPPEDLERFYNAIASGKGEFINGVRLVYPLEKEAMRFLNMVGNKFFSLAFSWLLDQPIKDTLCGTKVLRKRDYELIAENRAYFGDFDPFGDFDLLFGAAKLNFKIVEIPIRYRSRTYGNTNIDRWRHGWLLIKMALFAAKRIKFT